MSWEAQFGWGIFGSLAVELVLIVTLLDVAKPKWPEKYKHAGFVVARLAVAIASGMLAVAYNVQTPLLAINVGAAAPALFKTLAQGIKEQAKRAG